MKVYILMAGNGWDTSIGKVEAVFAHEDGDSWAFLKAKQAADDYINNRGGRFYWSDVPEDCWSPTTSGWELIGVGIDGDTYRFRKNGTMTEQFLTIHSMKVK